MYGSLHAQIFGTAATSASESNDGALVSAALKIAASLDSSPPATVRGVIARFEQILGADSKPASAIRSALNRLL
jgi:hypothetical protein